MVDLENFPTSDTAKEMLESVTKGWYERAYAGKWMFQVMGNSMDMVKKIYSELPDQFFVETATWGLAYHEQKYGLQIRNNLKYEERRKLIMQHMKSRVPMTPYHMEQLIKQQLGLDAEVSDIHDKGSLGYLGDHPNMFRVVIWDRGQNLELDYPAAEKLIRQANQSHTVFDTQHRQVFQEKVHTYAGALYSEQVEYEIRPRPVNHDVDTRAVTGTAALLDFMVYEEIGRSTDNGSKQ